MLLNRCSGSIAVGTALLVLGAACDLKPPAPKPEPVPDPAELWDPDDPCPGGVNTRLVVRRGDEILINADATAEIARRSEGDTADGPLRGRVAVSAASIAFGASHLELVPCTGDLVAVPATERFFFMVNKRGEIKVVDMDNQGKRVAKNLAEIRLLER